MTTDAFAWSKGSSMNTSQNICLQRLYEEIQGLQGLRWSHIPSINSPSPSAVFYVLAYPGILATLLLFQHVKYASASGPCTLLLPLLVKIFLHSRRAHSLKALQLSPSQAFILLSQQGKQNRIINMTQLIQRRHKRKKARTKNRWDK